MKRRIFSGSPRNILILALVLAVIVSGSCFFAYAWFAKNGEKTADAEALAVDTPPILYILDSDAEDITQLSLSGLEIGVDKQIVFCISSVYPVGDDTAGHEISFNIELAYTRNLGAKFDLYNAEICDQNTPGAIEYNSQLNTVGYFVKGDLMSGTDMSTDGNNVAYKDYANYNSADENGVQQNNVATYKRYNYSPISGDVNNNMFFTPPIPVTDPLFDTSKCRFFILNISWDQATLHKEEVEKETDIIYILARGGGLT